MAVVKDRLTRQVLRLLTYLSDCLEVLTQQSRTLLWKSNGADDDVFCSCIAPAHGVAGPDASGQYLQKSIAKENPMLDVATNVINKTNRSEFYSPPRRQYQQITQEYDPSLKALWTYMTPVSIPCFNQNLVEEIHHSFHVLDEKKGHFQKEDNWYPVNYSVIASRHPKVFNLGGDLALFISLSCEKNKAALMHYARLCVEALYVRLINFNSTVITISVVQGDALGGGFEFVT